MLFSHKLGADAFGRAYYRQQTHTRTHSMCMKYEERLWTMCICWKWFYEWNDVIRFAWENGLVYAHILQMKNLQMKIHAHTHREASARAQTHVHTHIYTRGVGKKLLKWKAIGKHTRTQCVAVAGFRHDGSSMIRSLLLLFRWCCCCCCRCRCYYSGKYAGYTFHRMEMSLMSLKSRARCVA